MWFPSMDRPRAGIIPHDTKCDYGTGSAEYSPGLISTINDKKMIQECVEIQTVHMVYTYILSNIQLYKVKDCSRSSRYKDAIKSIARSIVPPNYTDLIIHATIMDQVRSELDGAPVGDFFNSLNLTTHIAGNFLLSPDQNRKAYHHWPLADNGYPILFMPPL